MYYASASGALISFMDRVFYSGGKNLAFKPAAAVVSCRRAGASTTFDVINKYFTINNMPIVGSNYWNEIHGNTAEEAAQDAEGLQTMRMLGNNMAWLLKCIELGKEAAVEKVIPMNEADSETAGVNPDLLAFLDLDTLAEKLEMLRNLRKRMDDRLLDSIAASLDIVVEDGPLPRRYQEVLNCLETMEHFECSRFR